MRTIIDRHTLIKTPTVAELTDRIFYHYWREFCPDYVKLPVNVIEPCGDCGRARAEHPIPRLSVSGEEAARFVLSLTGGREVTDAE